RAPVSILAPPQGIPVQQETAGHSDEFAQWPCDERVDLLLLLRGEMIGSAQHEPAVGLEGLAHLSDLLPAGPRCRRRGVRRYRYRCRWSSRPFLVPYRVLYRSRLGCVLAESTGHSASGCGL